MRLLLPWRRGRATLVGVAPATEGRGLERAAVAGFGLIFAAALMLWWRYGPSVFIDGLAAAWRCF
jgi:hypothetical protein